MRKEIEVAGKISQLKRDRESALFGNSDVDGKENNAQTGVDSLVQIANSSLLATLFGASPTAMMGNQSDKGMSHIVLSIKCV